MYIYIFLNNCCYKGLRFNSSWGLRIFSLSHCHDKVKNILLYFFTELKTYHLCYFIYKNDAINIADPNSMQDMCHMNFVIDLAHQSLWLSGRALEQGIQRSDV